MLILIVGPYLDSSLQNRKVLYLNLKGPFTKQANSSTYDIKLTLAEKVVAGAGNDNFGSKGNGTVSDEMPEPVSDSQVSYLRMRQFSKKGTDNQTVGGFSSAFLSCQ